MSTQISYCHETLNPIIGCSPEMPCAQDCWARMTVNRLAGKFPEYKVCLTPGGKQWSGKALWRPKELEKLAHWKKGKRIFVCPQGDMFGPNVSIVPIDKIFWGMKDNGQHRYLVLTKKALRLLGRVRSWPAADFGHVAWGVSVMRPEDMKMMETLLFLDPAFKLWVSFEPLLAPVSHLLTPAMLKRLSWVVIGCLQLPGKKTTGWAAENEVEWRAEADILCGKCFRAGVPHYVKQYPSNGKVYAYGKPKQIPDFLTLDWER